MSRSTGATHAPRPGSAQLTSRTDPGRSDAPTPRRSEGTWAANDASHAVGATRRRRDAERDGRRSERGRQVNSRAPGVSASYAHVGSYVPADAAEEPLLRSGVRARGSADDPRAGQSTFVREMRETAAILKNATPRASWSSTRSVEGRRRRTGRRWRLPSARRCAGAAVHLHDALLRVV